MLSADMSNAVILPWTEPCSGVRAAGFGTGVRDGIRRGVFVTGCCVASEVFSQGKAERVAAWNVAFERPDMLVAVFPGGFCKHRQKGARRTRTEACSFEGRTFCMSRKRSFDLVGFERRCADY